MNLMINCFEGLLFIYTVYRKQFVFADLKYKMAVWEQIKYKCYRGLGKNS